VSSNAGTALRRRDRCRGRGVIACEAAEMVTGLPAYVLERVMRPVPVWGKLRADQKRRLTVDGLPFLLEQLKAHDLKLLLVNGSGAARALGSLVRVTGSARLDGATVEIGVIDAVLVVSWSTNLQSSFGVRNVFRSRLADNVAALARP
jgi:hypothetical protein